MIESPSAAGDLTILWRGGL